MADIQSAIRGINRSLDYVQSCISSNKHLYKPTQDALLELHNLSIKLANLTEEALNLTKSEQVKTEFVEFEEVLDPKSAYRLILNTLKSVAETPEKSFSYKPAHMCAELCFSYFSTRFNKKYDPEHIHKFDQKRYIDYLVSIVLDFSQHVYRDSLTQYTEDFYEWIYSIKDKGCKYTLPKSAFTIFNRIVKSSTSSFTFEDESLFIAKQIWAELWDKGYYHFAELQLTSVKANKAMNWGKLNNLHPNSNMLSTTHLTVEACSDYDTIFDLSWESWLAENIENNADYSIYKDRIRELYSHYIEFIYSPCYFVFKFIASQDSTWAKLCNVNKDEYFASMPEGLIAKSLICYVLSEAKNIEDSIDKLLERIQEMILQSDDMGKHCKDFKSVYDEFLNSTSSLDLDIGEVFQYYVRYYEVIDRG